MKNISSNYNKIRYWLILFSFLFLFSFSFTKNSQASFTSQTFNETSTDLLAGTNWQEQDLVRLQSGVLNTIQFKMNFSTWDSANGIFFNLYRVSSTDSNYTGSNEMIGASSSLMVSIHATGTATTWINPTPSEVSSTDAFYTINFASTSLPVLTDEGYVLKILKSGSTNFKTFGSNASSTYQGGRWHTELHGSQTGNLYFNINNSSLISGYVYTPTQSSTVLVGNMASTSWAISHTNLEPFPEVYTAIVQYSIDNLTWGIDTFCQLGASVASSTEISLCPTQVNWTSLLNNLNQASTTVYARVSIYQGYATSILNAQNLVYKFGVSSPTSFTLLNPTTNINNQTGNSSTTPTQSAWQGFVSSTSATYRITSSTIYLDCNPSFTFDGFFCGVTNLWNTTLNKVTSLLALQTWVNMGKSVFPFSIPLTVYDNLQTAINQVQNTTTTSQIDLVIAGNLSTRFPTSTRTMRLIASSQSMQSMGASASVQTNWFKFQQYMLDGLLMITILFTIL